MFVMNKGGKSQNRVRRENKFAQGVQNSAEIVIENGKNAKSTTVDNDVQFEIFVVETEF